MDGIVRHNLFFPLTYLNKLINIVASGTAAKLCTALEIKSNSVLLISHNLFSNEY